MKVINHNKNNYKYDKNGAVMRGTVEITLSEYASIVLYLKKQKKALKECYNLFTDRLYDIDSNTLSLGVTPTILIFKHFNLSRYKHQNYQFKIIKSHGNK